MALKYRPIIGRYLDIDGTPKVGYIEFTPNVDMISSDDGVLTISSVRMYLQEDGTFEGMLACTDSENVFPVGWLWQVEEKVPYGMTFWLEFPFGDGSPFDILASRNPGLKPPGYQIEGTPGLPAIVTVESTVTSAPGSPAHVEDMDTASSRTANLRFTIPRGEPGPGVAAGGTTGQALIKKSNADYDMGWQTFTGLSQEIADERYVNIDGDNVTGKLTLTNSDKLLEALKLVRTVLATSTNDADIFVIEYPVGVRGTWVNEKGQLRSSNEGAPAEVILKLIASPTNTADLIQTLKSDGSIYWRVGPNGRAIANAGMRMVGVDFQIQDTTAADQSTISQPTGGDLTIAPKNNLSVSGKKITNLAAGSANTDAANVGQLAQFLLPSEVLPGSNVSVDTTTAPGSVIISAAGVGTGYVLKTGDEMSGNLTIKSAPDTSSRFIANGMGPAGYGEVAWLRNDLGRWLMRTANNTEPDATGKPNSGSDLQIISRNDDGSSRKALVTINRESGVFQHHGSVVAGLATNAPYQNFHAASYYSGGNVTGYLVIKVPLTALNSFSLFKIRGYDYGNSIGEWALDVGGYLYSSGWVANKNSARASGRFPGGKRRLPVRLLTRGVAGAREFAIAIGEVDTVWTSATVVLDLVTSAALALSGGINISVTTDITTPDWTTQFTLTPETPYAPNVGALRRLTLDVDQSIPNNVNTVVTGYVPSSGDTGEGVITLTSAKNLTVNETGYYDITVYTNWDVNNTGARWIHINNNGTNIYRDIRTAASSSSGALTVTAVYLSAGDVLTASVMQTSGVAILLNSSAFIVRKVSGPL